MKIRVYLQQANTRITVELNVGSTCRLKKYVLWEML